MTTSRRPLWLGTGFVEQVHGVWGHMQVPEDLAVSSASRQEGKPHQPHSVISKPKGTEKGAVHSPKHEQCWLVHRRARQKVGLSFPSWLAKQAVLLSQSALGASPPLPLPHFIHWKNLHWQRVFLLPFPLPSSQSYFFVLFPPLGTSTD